MALLVHDGSIGSDYSSYASLSDADAFCLARNIVEWAAATTTAREAALVRATDFIDATYTFTEAHFVDGAVHPLLTKALLTLAPHALADEMMDGEFAVSATLVRASGGGYDKAAGKITAGSETLIPCRAVMGARRTVTGNGAVVIQTMATINVMPVDGDKLRIGSNTYTFTTVEEIAPDGIPVIYRGVMK